MFKNIFTVLCLSLFTATCAAVPANAQEITSQDFWSEDANEAGTLIEMVFFGEQFCEITVPEEIYEDILQILEIKGYPREVIAQHLVEEYFALAGAIAIMKIPSSYICTEEIVPHLKKYFSITY